jgi:hypothetical protein
MKKNLKLDNKLILKLKIKPLSPLCIKLSIKNEEGGSNNYSAMLTTKGGTINSNEKIKSNNKNKLNDKEKVDIYIRDGEIYIPGSTLKGLFRDRFLTMYGNEASFIKELFGYNDENKKEAKKSRFFIQDAFFSEESKREKFNSSLSTNEVLKEIVKSRAITPIDHFSLKARVPLQYEYTTEEFLTELIINNVTKKDLQGIFFVIRDSMNGEIRIGNSKTRGFGQIELQVNDLRYDIYYGQEDISVKTFGIKEEEIEEFFDLDKKNSIKIGENYFSKVMHLKEEYREVDIKNPNNFIKKLFNEVER